MKKKGDQSLCIVNDVIVSASFLSRIGWFFSPPKTKEDTNHKPSIRGIFPSGTHRFKDVGPAGAAGLSRSEDKCSDK